MRWHVDDSVQGRGEGGGEVEAGEEALRPPLVEREGELEEIVDDRWRWQRRWRG